MNANNAPPPIRTERPLPSINGTKKSNVPLYIGLGVAVAVMGGFALMKVQRHQKADGSDKTVSVAKASGNAASAPAAPNDRLDAGLSTPDLPPPNVPIAHNTSAAPAAGAPATTFVPAIPLRSGPSPPSESTVTRGGAHTVTPTERRRLSPLVALDSGAAATANDSSIPSSGTGAGKVPHMEMPQMPNLSALNINAMGAGGSSASSAGAGQASGSGNSLGTRLVPTRTVEVQASVLQNRDFLITKGGFLDCILETKINTAVPGMVTCRLDRDEYGSTGRVALLDRGSKLIGEYQGSVKRGENRIFVLWTRAETPNGVVIDLNSPGTDELGEAGLGGYIDSHFWERFGSALLLSIVEDGVSAAASSVGNTGGTTVRTTQDAASIAVENSINIAPTLIKNQGERVNILIARDLDFSTAYALATNSGTATVNAASTTP